MSAPVDPKAAEMWIAGLGMALVEMKDSEIAALRAENERLRAALEDCIEILDDLKWNTGAVERARAALGE